MNLQITEEKDEKGCHVFVFVSQTLIFFWFFKKKHGKFQPKENGKEWTFLQRDSSSFRTKKSALPFCMQQSVVLRYPSRKPPLNSSKHAHIGGYRFNDFNEFVGLKEKLQMSIFTIQSSNTIVMQSQLISHKSIT